MEEVKDKKQSFMKGVFVLMMSQVFIKILGFVYRWYMTNKPGFGDEGNGLYGAGFQIYTLLLAISSTGVPNAISKLVSERIAIGDYKAAKRVFKIALLLFGGIGLFGASVLFFGANYIANVVLSNSRVENILVVLAPSVFFVSLSSVIRGYFAGFQNMKATANSQFLEQVFKTVLTIAIISILTGQSVEIMATGANVATTLATALSFSYLYIFYQRRKKEINKKVNNTKHTVKDSFSKVIKSIISVSIPIALSSFISAINRNVDSITVIRGLKGIGYSEETANVLYGMLSGKIDNIINLPLSFNIAFAISLVPAISAAMAKKDEKTATKRISFSLLVSMLIGLPCTFGLAVLASPILKLLYPNAPDGGSLMQLSAMVIIFTILAQTVNGALQGLGKVIIPATALACGAVAKVITNIVLISIPEINIYGAAIGSLVCHVISFAIGFTVLRKNIKLELTFNKFVLKPIIATFMMCICTMFSYNMLVGIIGNSKATIIALIVAVIIYALSVIVLKIFKKEDFYMMPYGQKVYKVLYKLGIYSE